MPIYCTGVTASWDSVSLGEVTEIKVVSGGGQPQARACAWTIDAGQVDLATLSTTGLSVASYGKLAVLSLSGGGMRFSNNSDFTAKAVLQRLDMTGTVNDVARYAASFKLVSTATTAT